ncbi:hypothetical protein ACFL35_04315 [Candidatus Riflebacteria bacterium]
MPGLPYTPTRIYFLTFTLFFFFSTPLFAYLDPGTFSYIMQILASLIIGLLVFIKTFWQNIKEYFRGSGGRAEKVTEIEKESEDSHVDSQNSEQ